ncbi:hypothetical protein D3C75_396140 [compost metagenome]
MLPRPDRFLLPLILLKALQPVARNDRLRGLRIIERPPQPAENPFTAFLQALHAQVADHCDPGEAFEHTDRPQHILVLSPFLDERNLLPVAVCNNPQAGYKRADPVSLHLAAGAGIVVLAGRHLLHPDPEEFTQNRFYFNVNRFRLPAVPEGILQRGNLLHNQLLNVRVMHEMLMHLDLARLNPVLQVMCRVSNVITQVHQLGLQRLLAFRNSPVPADLRDIIPFGQIHPLLQHRAGKRVLVDPQQHGIGQIQPVDILTLLQEHNQPEIMGIALKMLILPFHIPFDRLHLHRAGA